MAETGPHCPPIRHALATTQGGEGKGTERKISGVLAVSLDDTRTHRRRGGPPPCPVCPDGRLHGVGVVPPSPTTSKTVTL